VLQQEKNMKTANANRSSHLHSSAAALQKNACGLLVLSTLLLYGLVAPTAAQTTPTMRVAPEKGFTIAPEVSTPIVLRTMPDAACDLRVEGASDEIQALRFYANGEGYIKIHARPDEETQESRVQLDCAANGKIIRYPLHLVVNSEPTEDMPAPRSEMPAPRGSQVLRALTEDETRLLSDEELLNRGYPARPDPAGNPEQYASWLQFVSQPNTLLPTHLVSTDISHHPYVQAGVSTSSNWSGYVGNGPNKRTYDDITGYYTQPELIACYTNNTTYSAFWDGLDGYIGLSDLVQAGTEADCTNSGGTDFFNYQAWEELLPNQPTEQNVGISPNPADAMQINVWIGDSSGHVTQNGAYAWFYIADFTQSNAARVNVPLSGTYFAGKTAEWIMERPTVSGGLPLFSDYSYAYMDAAAAYKFSKNVWLDYSQLNNLVQLWMYNAHQHGSDNNLLSSATENNATSIYFQWHHYH
jgi:peptidase A4-like protein